MQQRVEAYMDRVQQAISVGLTHVLILGAVNRRAPIHGYALMQEMTASLDGETPFPQGTIYPILKDLEKAGVIRSRWAAGESGPARKYYELTAAGQQALRETRRYWSRVRDGIETLLEKDERP